MVSFRPRGCHQITVVNLAIQRSCQIPYPQPSRSATMADGVRCQFMHGQNHVLSLVFVKPRVAGTGSHLCPRRMQHV